MNFNSAPDLPQVISADLHQAYVNQGYVRLPGFLGKKEVETVKANLKRYIAEVVPRMPGNEVYYEDKSDKSTLKQIQRMHQWDDFCERLFLKSRFFALAAQLLGRAIIGKNLQYFNKPPSVGAPTPPHQDGYYWKIVPMEGLTMWLALEAVDAENGCVRYIAGSHRQGVRTHGRTETLGFSQSIVDYGPEDMQNETPIAAQAGDLLVHDALTIHRADGNRSASRTRQALGFIYFSARAREDAEAIKKYQENVLSDMKAKGKL